MFPLITYVQRAIDLLYLKDMSDHWCIKCKTCVCVCACVLLLQQTEMDFGEKINKNFN